MSTSGKRLLAEFSLPQTRCSALMQETGFNNGQSSFDCPN
jgi:hypothetical protein